MTETKEIIELYQVAEIYQTSLQEVHNLVKDLNRKVSNLVECINPLRFCKEINQNELEKQLSDIYQISQSIQDSLKEIAESTDFETKDWQDEEGLHSYIDELELHLKERKLSLNRRQRLHSLAEELERYTIKHRSKQQKSDLVDLRDAAARDLRKIFLQKKAPYLPGPEDINNWLNWALNLENDSLEEVQSELAKINKELSQFICTCELSWLIKNKEEIDKEKISIEEVSKEELSQKEPLIEEPSEEEASIAEPSKEESLKEEVLKKDKEKPPEWDSVDFTGLVQILIQKDKKASCIELQMLVVKLLERRELALAYHLARLSEEL
jgi:predicted component of type VI protein secretion system